MSIPADVRAFLAEIVGKDDIAALEREAKSWRGSGDLNEEWIADLRLRAGQLLSGEPSGVDGATVELLDAATEWLARTFVHNLEYATYPPEREQYEAGVSRVLRVTEALAPSYEDPTARAVEIAYLDRAGVEREHNLWSVSVEELLRDSGVRVPEHRLTWTVSRG